MSKEVCQFRIADQRVEPDTPIENHFICLSKNGMIFSGYRPK